MITTSRKMPSFSFAFEPSLREEVRFFWKDKCLLQLCVLGDTMSQQTANTTRVCTCFLFEWWCEWVVVATLEYKMCQPHGELAKFQQRAHTWRTNSYPVWKQNLSEIKSQLRGVLWAYGSWKYYYQLWKKRSSEHLPVSASWRHPARPQVSSRSFCYSLGWLPFVRVRWVNERLWSHQNSAGRVQFLGSLTSVATIIFPVLFFSVVVQHRCTRAFLFFLLFAFLTCCLIVITPVCSEISRQFQLMKRTFDWNKHIVPLNSLNWVLFHFKYRQKLKLCCFFNSV